MENAPTSTSSASSALGSIRAVGWIIFSTTLKED
jgi:hypothetical protein